MIRSSPCFQELEMLKEQGRVKELEHEEELGVLRSQANQGQSQSGARDGSVRRLGTHSGDSVPVTEGQGQGQVQGHCLADLTVVASP